MNESCLDCKYADWTILSSTGYCSWRAMPPVPTWVDPIKHKTDINKKRPYVDCPAWEVEEKRGK